MAVGDAARKAAPAGGSDGGKVWYCWWHEEGGFCKSAGKTSATASAVFLCAGIQVLLFWAVQGWGGRSANPSGCGSGSCAPLSAGVAGLPIHFFTAAKPFAGEVGERQLQALKSWLRLRPVVEVVLLGDDPSFYEVSDQFPGKVSVEPSIDYNFLGIPQFHSMVARVQAAAAASSSSGIYVLANADIYTLYDFLPVLQKVAHRFPNWVVTGNRWDVPDFPYSLVESRGHFPQGAEERRPLRNPLSVPWTVGPFLWRDKNSGRLVKDEDVREYVLEHGVLHTHGGLDLWAWNGGAQAPPLFQARMPPFAYGRGRYDNWMTHEMLLSGGRTVVDASTALTAIHVSHSYAHLTDVHNSTFSEARGVKNFWSSNKRSNYEADANIYLSRQRGSFEEQRGMALHVPWKMLPCAESVEGHLCLMQYVKAGSCRCSYAVWAKQTQNEMEARGRAMYCGHVPQEIEVGAELIPKERGLRTPGFPLMLEDLLSHVADENETVVLTVAGGLQKHLVASLACRLKEMHINLLVCAVDQDLYTHAFNLGTAVYMDSIRKEERYGDMDCEADPFCEPEMHFILPAVLHLLKQGKNVVLTDPGFYWLRDPRSYLLSHGTNTLLGSLMYEEELPPEAFRQFDLKFLFARAERTTISALEAVLNFAVAANITEDESFNVILCGLQGEKWAKTAGCVYDNGLNLLALTEEQLKSKPLSNVEQVHGAARRCHSPTCIAIDVGGLALNGTLEKSEFWRQDHVNQMCIHPWSNTEANQVV